MGLLFLLLVCVDLVESKIEVTVPFNAVSFQQPITYTAIVTPKPPGAGPFGQVTFTDNGKNTIPASAPLKLVNGQAVAVLNTQIKTGPSLGDKNPEQHSIVAKYQKQTSAVLKISVYQGESKTVLTTSSTSYPIGSTIQATATITKVKGSLTFNPTAARIKFRQNDKNINCQPKKRAGKAFIFDCTFVASGLIGSQNLAVYYLGEGAYGGSSSKKSVNFVCQAPLLDCNGDKICETNPKTSSIHCGRCNNPCASAFPHATSHCSNAVCVKDACVSGFGDCSAQAGCETDVTVNPNNCGACGARCSTTFPNAESHCANSTCVQDSCLTGFGDCSATPGCETDLTTSAAHCSSCGTDCATVYPHAQSHCSDSVCVQDSCLTDFFDCISGDFPSPDAGCETNVTQSSAHCGECGNDCSVAFPNAASHCANSVCVQDSCTAGFGDCTAELGCESNFASSTANCGRCGRNCDDVFINAKGKCESGSCELDNCLPGFGNCLIEAGDSDGCETNLTSDDHHCGSCNDDCTDGVTIPNAIGQCTSSTCVFADCKSGYGNCDSDSGNGCEFSCPVNGVTTAYDQSLVEWFSGQLNCTYKLDSFKQKIIPRLGSGNPNGKFTVASSDGIDIGLRAEIRGTGGGPITPVSGTNTYVTTVGPSPSTTFPKWNYAFSVDLRRGIAPHQGKTLADYRMEFKYEVLDNSVDYPAWSTKPTGDAKAFASNLIVNDICGSCSMTPGLLDFTTPDNDEVTWANCSDLAAKTTNKLYFFQESTNLAFQFSDFPYNSPGSYQITLSLIPESSCDCPLSVSIKVLVQ